ncbi:MAG: deoxyribonuclease V [Chloroflexota bacterium]
MKIPMSSRWDVTPAEAIAIQRELAARVGEQDALDDTRLVAGVDVGFEGADNQTARAAVVVLQFPELVLLDYAIARLPVQFPYIPGLLAFREIPVVLRALEHLKTDPDVLIVDGQGRAHPRRLGIASHLGVLLDRATIGCAKSILCGAAKEPANRAGAWSPLMDRGEQIGAAVRTRVGVAPVYVSVGHRVSLARAIDIVMRCCKGYRLPETTRYAHRVAGGETLKLSSVQASLL